VPALPNAPLTARFGLALLAALAACGLACSRRPPVPERPNMLLISVDCLRADHLSCYGYARQTSPTIDSLAHEGVRFERALSASGWTLPSHLSMLTGTPMSVHGVEDERLWLRVDASGKPLPVSLRGVFTPEILHDAGYATAGFYTVGWLDPRYGFGPGFDTWERLGQTFYSHPVVGPMYRRIKAAGDVKGLNELRKTYPELFDRSRRSTPETIDRAIGWLDEHQKTKSGQPFFLFMHLFDAHEPYLPPPPYDTLFEPAPESGEAGRLMAKYDGSIRALDAELARLLARLAALGLDKNTLIVLTGDHGEEFTEHGNYSHRIELYLENIHVPLVLRWPDGLPAGKLVRGDAGHVDIAATLYAAAGVRKPSFVLGTDLLPIARGEAGNAPRTYVAELAVFRDGVVPARHLTILRGDELRVLRCRGRSPWSGVRFDLAQNPEGRGAGEPLDLGGSEGKRLESDLAELRASFQHARALAPLRQGDARPLTRQDRDEIEALGYTGSDEKIPGHESSERLFLDGGVWPDE
jgi:arylsulfatase A-like enzyme